ncbi:MAG: low specificity L-threonine aldolase [Bacteroidales bacterium]|nr:low specificity L-threonine aldolase [Bacteroidales bacterium]
MISFESDYIAGAHPKVLERLAETNMEALVGYGEDKYCRMAEEKIKKACKRPDAKVHFLVGGTQTNQVVISSMLADYEGVIAATSGHISVHEGGAIEFTGHKVLTLQAIDGKLNAQDIDEYITTFHADGNHEHIVFPGMVYISHPTEYGTLYCKSELTAISNVCKKHNIPLFLDGARLGYGLASRQIDVSLPDIAELCDVFYIGGTKVGALCGEAVVFTHNNTPKHFITKMKQRGALLAKGRLLGIQFDTLFTNDIYMEISRHAIEMAEKLKSLLKERSYQFYIESPTNQQFIILSNEQMNKLAQNVCFSFWEKYDDSHTIVRFATSWSTTEDDLKELEKWL